MMEQTDLSIIRGDTGLWSLTMKNAVTKAVYDLTGATCFFTLKNDVTDADASAVLKVDWTTHTTAASGLTNLTLTAAQTAALAPRDYVYDIQVKVPTGDIYTVAVGVFTVTADVTTRTTAV